MSIRPPSLLGGWLTKWRSYQFPWRQEWQCGTDLQGNTYWEFIAGRGMGLGRHRRIVKCPKNTPLHSINPSPMWYQWLRHQRTTPPTLHEQKQEEIRLRNIKVLAAAADARWESKPRLVNLRGGLAASYIQKQELTPVTIPEEIAKKGPRERLLVVTEPVAINPWWGPDTEGAGFGWDPEKLPEDVVREIKRQLKEEEVEAKKKLEGEAKLKGVEGWKEAGAGDKVKGVEDGKTKEEVKEAETVGERRKL